MGRSLYQAASTGRVADALEALAVGAKVNYIFEEDDTPARTPLHAAAIAGHQAMVEFLYQNGADMNAKDRDSLTPMDLATQASHLGVVKLLSSKQSHSSDAAPRVSPRAHASTAEL